MKYQRLLSFFFASTLLGAILLPTQSYSVDADPSLVSATLMSDYQYDPSGRRDPFAPLIEEKSEVVEAVADVPEMVRGPLEKYELSQFRLMAIVVIKGVPNAMVATPDGKSYRVKEGDYIGLKHGLVQRIETKSLGVDEHGLSFEKNPDRIVVEESGYDKYSGARVTENRFIAM